MSRLVPKHAWPLRLIHWLNIPILAVMIWSGLLIYWAYDPYRIEIAGTVWFKFFPDWFYAWLRLEFSLAIGMAYHFTFAWFFALNGLAYVIYTFVSGHWRELFPTLRTPIDAFQVVLHDLGLFAFLGLATQDGGYYIGLDMPSALHPQTLLCDQMNGEPLPMNHGAPLRLILPVKYGIKNIKWISRIFFADEPPADYWAERGYDWYAGL
jgi:hypothetical protein